MVQPTLKENGFAHIFIIFLLLLSIGVGVYLIQQKTHFFSGAVSEPVSGPVTPTVLPTTTPAEANAKRIFVTSAKYKGHLIGGLAGANSKCQERADAAGLGGSWKAWFSANNYSPSNKYYPSYNFSHFDGPYNLVNGKNVALRWSDLIRGGLRNPINVTELGGTYMGPVWTNTNYDGTQISLATSCTGSTSGGAAWVGYSYFSSKSWTDAITQNCSESLALYCFEQ